MSGIASCAVTASPEERLLAAVAEVLHNPAIEAKPRRANVAFSHRWAAAGLGGPSW
jgi:hypothetical protein